MKNNINNPTPQEQIDEKRLKVGRSQKSYTSNTKLFHDITRENKAWILVMVFITAIIIVTSIIIFSKTNIPNLNEMAFFTESLSLTTIAIIFFIYLPILLRITYNFIISQLLEIGQKKQIPLLNFIVSLINGIFNLALLTAITASMTSALMALKTGTFSVQSFNFIETLKNSQESSIGIIQVSSHTTMTTPDSATQTIKIIIILYMIAALIAFIMTTYILTLIIFNTIDSITTAIHSFLLKPKNYTIDNETIITNVYPTDYEKIEELYTKTSRTEHYTLTNNDFKKFTNRNEKNKIINYRVILKNSELIGFYTLNKKYNELHDIKIHRKEHSNQNFIDPILKDYENIAISKRNKEIKVLFKNENNEKQELEKYLTLNNWKFIQQTEDGKVSIYSKELKV